MVTTEVYTTLTNIIQENGSIDTGNVYVIALQKRSTKPHIERYAFNPRIANLFLHMEGGKIPQGYLEFQDA